jgi:hypothetical protein
VFLHPLAKAPQVWHIIGSAAYAARALELSAGVDPAVGSDQIAQSRNLVVAREGGEALTGCAAATSVGGGALSRRRFIVRSAEREFRRRWGFGAGAGRPGSVRGRVGRRTGPG